MKTAQSKVTLGWPYVIALFLLFGLSIGLRTANIVGPKPVVYTAHALSDQDGRRLVAIQKNFNRVAQPPRLPVAIGAVNDASLRYLVLVNAGDINNTVELRGQLSYFEASMQAVPKLRTGANQTVLDVPILMYHRTPPDFAAQMKHLVDHHYTSISLAELWQALRFGVELPSKPVVITLDDGYKDQLAEIAILRRYGLRATLYVINGGLSSKWCIGASAKQQSGCESYLSWDQIRSLDREGLITIGSHTSNHPDLAGLTTEQQQAEIIGGKQELEKQLGHVVYDFAYPYGSFNAVSVDIVKQAGFRTATTTQPGAVHSRDGMFTLTRLRDSLSLP